MKSNSKNTNDRILDAATEIFSKKGFDGANMREIAAKAGVSLQMIYYYFKNKKALYFNLFKEHTEKISEGVHKVLSSGKEDLVIFRKLISFYEKTIQEHPRILHLGLRDLKTNDELYNYITKNFFYKIHSETAAFLKKGAEKGVFRFSNNFYLSSINLVSIIIIHQSSHKIINQLSEYFGDVEVSSKDCFHSHLINLFTKVS